MGKAAFITPGKRGRWTLTVGTDSSNHQEFDQAIQAAQGVLVEAGGGTIYTGAGHGLKANSFRVICEPKAVAPPATPEPPPETPARPPAPATPVSATVVPVSSPPQTSDIAAQIAALGVSYEEAKGEIEAFGDPVEQDIGKGTLRHEATQTLASLRVSDTPAEVLLPLAEQVQGLTGGKTTEVAIAGLDKAGAKVLKDVGKSLLGLKLVGSTTAIVGLIAAFSDLTVSFGSALAAAVVAGTLAVGPASRVVMHAVPAGERAFFASTRWAEELGRQTDLVLKEPRKIQAQISALAGAPSTAQSALAQKARLRAGLIIALCWAAIIFGLLGILAGFAGGFG
jgi:hypothetical protein